MKRYWMAGLTGVLLLTLTAGCASTSKTEAPRTGKYAERDVWVGTSGKYDVRVRIEKSIIAGREQCSLREVEMKPAAGLHREAWGYVRAYDYGCNGRFDTLRFRYEDDQRRAASVTERLELKDELWFAFGTVVPVDKQMAY